ncbi:hypothetical protein Sango_2107400 [Sesamum angolense]|uniref:Reverse transcriptase zinc-binding domain-containing protein n=1 Tax=Sesamum angolense TaxID=2727404 RepID=A0AAE2BM39_9LAMI|nr:hypothetical protein Sango_2107400 [Sesamum angolense]
MNNFFLRGYCLDSGSMFLLCLLLWPSAHDARWVVAILCHFLMTIGFRHQPHFGLFICQPSLHRISWLEILLQRTASGMREVYARCRRVDTDCILSIRLKAKGTTNKLVWHFDCNGLFSVKSAYKLATSATNSGPSSTNMSFLSDGAASWRFVWGSLVVPNVQLFTWRCCANAIPTLDNLRCKGVDVDGGCPNCGEETEDLHHALHSSSFARLVWAL